MLATTSVSHQSQEGVGPARTYSLPTTSPWEGATVAERLACSPYIKANRAQSPARSLPDFRMWESCRKMNLVGEFYRGSTVFLRPFIPALLHTHLTHSHRLARPRLVLAVNQSNVLTRRGGVAHLGRALYLRDSRIDISTQGKRAPKSERSAVVGGVAAAAPDGSTGGHAAPVLALFRGSSGVGR
ncbi:hypothetical protein PR048_021194 [Dryococelus australis]|uniref:Uncharacterized protein n=1 Tax=Dryococelus australis TaxID=614101 RepID=A0ABQ9GXK4_9NEOP|nr:hypothetical protein PR048_021194 [Dryococelus australis]